MLRRTHARTLRFVLSAALLTCGAATLADEPAPGGKPEPIGPTQAAAKSAYSNKQICHLEPVAGSHIKKKICRTQEQIDAERESSQGSMSNLNNAKGAISMGEGS